MGPASANAGTLLSHDVLWMHTEAPIDRYDGQSQARSGSISNHLSVFSCNMVDLLCAGEHTASPSGHGGP